MIDIIVPTPMPAGAKHQAGDRLDWPVCDRCLRKTSERNPIILDRRVSENFREALAGKMRCDAICTECRQFLKGER